MQTIAALFYVFDPITNQDTATMRSLEFNDFYTRVIAFTNSTNIVQGSVSRPSVNAINTREAFHLDELIVNKNMK